MQRPMLLTVPIQFTKTSAILAQLCHAQWVVEADFFIAQVTEVTIHKLNQFTKNEI
jgi:lysophospholipase L1-like esterase